MLTAGLWTAVAVLIYAVENMPGILQSSLICYFHRRKPNTFKVFCLVT